MQCHDENAFIHTKPNTAYQYHIVDKTRFYTKNIVKLYTCDVMLEDSAHVFTADVDWFVGNQPRDCFMARRVRHRTFICHILWRRR